MYRKLSLIAALAIATGYAACSPEQEADTNNTTAASNEMSEGKKLFMANCRTCHLAEKDATGPALKGAMQRWNNDTARLYSFVRNPSKMIEEGDERAVEVYEKWYHTQMTPFPNLTDEEINAILHYVETGN